MIRDNNAFLMAMGNGSRVEIHAADAKKESWTKLDKTAQAGANTLSLSEATGWEVGDKIAIAASGFDGNEAESFTITQVRDGGRTVVLDRPLEHMHYGETQTFSNGKAGANNQTWTLDQRAEVALLSRNVTIQGDADSVNDGYGGHTMIMNGASMHIDGAEFTKMGQQGILGKYALHWHMNGDATGQYITNSSVHDTYNKGITLHGVSNTWLENNVVYDTVGHGYFFEDGSERGNVLKDNLGFATKAAESVAATPHGSDFSAVSTYWIMNPNNHMIGNVAAGSEGSGFWYTHQRGVRGSSAEDGRFQNIRPAQEQHGTFEGNVSHSNAENGLAHAEQINEATGDLSFGHYHKDIHIDGFTAYKNGDLGIWTRSANGVHVEDSVFADNKTSTFLAGQSLISDSLFVGRSDNTQGNGAGPGERNGNQWYDMPVAVEDSHFADFSGATDTAMKRAGGFFVSSTNSMEGLTWEDTPFHNRFDANTGNQRFYSDWTTHTALGVVDVDGSTSGVRGATLTPMIIDGQRGKGIDIINQGSTGFNAGKNAQLNGAASHWVNRDADIGIQRMILDGSDPNINFTIGRSDNGSKIRITEGASLGNRFVDMVVVGGERNDYVEYEIEFAPGERRPVFRMETDELEQGSVVYYRLKGVPTNFSTEGVQKVYSRAALDNANKTTVFVAGNGDVIIKSVADIYTFPHQKGVAAQSVAEQHWGDKFNLVFDGRGQVKADTFPATQARNVQSDEALAITDAPDRAASTSKTVDITNTDARWSDAATWNGGVPDANDTVIIGPGKRVILDQNVTVKAILIAGGELVVEDIRDLELAADWILVNNGGLFQAGTEDNPHVHDFTLTLEGDNRGLDVDAMALMAANGPNIARARLAPGEAPATPGQPQPQPDPDPQPQPNPQPQPDNQAPVARDDTATTPHNRSIVVDVLANDRDPEGGQLRLIDAAYAGNTSLVSIEDGKIKVNPLGAVNQARTEVITYTVADAGGKTTTAQLEVSVGGAGGGIPTPPPPAPPANQAPVAAADSVQTPQNTTVVVDVLANDRDPEGGGLRLTDISYDGNSAIVSIVDGKISVNPLARFTQARTEVIEYTVEDNKGAATTAVLEVKVGGGAPTPPVQQPQPPAPQPAGRFEVEVIDADNNDLVVGTLENGSIINKSDLKGGVSVKADFTGAGLESVGFSLDGGAERFENFEPYALFADRSGDINGGDIAPGVHTLTLTAYDQARGQGNVLGKKTFTFTVTEDQPDDPSELLDFFFVDTQSDADLEQLFDDASYDRAALSLSTSIYAVKENPGADIGRVVLSMDGHRQVEQIEPFALFGDTNGNFQGGQTLSPGAHELDVDVYNRAGQLVESMTLGFDIV